MRLAALDKTIAAIPGASLTRDRSGRYYALYADAPAGYLWVANGCHCYMTDTAADLKAWREEAEQDVLAAVAMGLEPCTDPDCDTCHSDP